MKHRVVVGFGAAIVALGGAGVAVAAPGQQTGPSSSQTPYLVPTTPGVSVRSVLTTGDAVGSPADPYRMVGIPDGLGAYDNGNGTFTVLMNHELRANQGATRAHGSTGAFVSRWVVQKGSMRVVSGSDLIDTVYRWNGSGYVQGTTAFSRFCSANLPDVSAFYDEATGLGTTERIFMNGEENDLVGRAIGTIVTGPRSGEAWELPALGKFAWENSVAKPGGGADTVVVGLDDGTGGQVYVYVGAKTSATNPIEAAGLTNGTLYGVKVAGVSKETDATTIAPGTAFELVPLGDVTGLSGAQLEALSTSKGVTSFQRPEDGSWDPSTPTGFWFATTAAFAGRSRLWNLQFSDSTDVTLGGTLSVAINNGPAPTGLDAASVPRMMDNLTVNSRGQVIIQEDVGNQAYLGSIWQYDPTTGGLRRIAQHDPARFSPGAPGFLTQDEESSGIIPMEGILGEGWYLADVQAHVALTDTELVEGGQLVAMKIPPGQPVR